MSEVVLDLPVPPSVNQTRRIDWASAKPVLAKWRLAAHAILMATGFKRRAPIPRFELLIVISEDHTQQDLDNPLKNLIDYLRLIEVIENDAKKNMRRIVVEWGAAMHGCKVTVRPCA